MANFYTTCDPIGVGCLLYTDVDLTTLVPDGYYSDSTTCYTTVDGSVTVASTCFEPRCCGPDQALSSDGKFCQSTETLSLAGTPETPELMEARSGVSYSTCGARIYDFGYATNGTGPSTTPGGLLWYNGVGTCTDATTTDGPLNSCGLWTETTAVLGQTVGFSVCLTVPTTGVYYIGVGSDTQASIVVDGTTKVAQVASSLDTYYSISGSARKIWHIYPVLLYTGQRVVEIIGTAGLSNPVIGAKIYNNTKDEIINANAPEDLNVIFDSADKVGEYVLLGNEGIGYVCPDGYSLTTCEDPYICIHVTNYNTIAC